ncbi:MAG TPA: hypothetical protein VGO48_00680 [Conexibacter sp.]|jgi:hypothetical protein|nr:hypothetical protein [Conexibacter sp.]
MLRRSGLVAAIATTLAVVSASSAVADGTWSATATLPAGSSATTYAQVLSPPGGGTLLWQWQDRRPVLVPISPAGALGTPQPFPTDARNDASGKPAHAYFLPNGDALFSYEPFNSSALHLVYRFANGTFGPVFAVPNTPLLRALAVRSGQVLLVEDSEGANPVLSAHTMSIGVDGRLTANADAVAIYRSPLSDTFGTHINYVGAAISADGTADVVAFVDHSSMPTGFEVVDVQRAPDAAGGGWSPARSLSASVDPEHVADGGPTFVGSNGAPTADPIAVAPGGRAILGFTVDPSDPGRNFNTSGAIYALVREPGGTFGAPQLTSATPPNRAGVASYVQVAAGGDGTLAIASNFMSCADSNFTTLSYTPVVASVAAPGSGLAAVPVPGGDSTAQTRVTPTSLGAGAGRAIVGLTTKTNTGSVLPLNGCGSYSTSGQSGTLGDGAVITGGPDGTDVATFANLPWPEGRPPTVRVDAAGLDAAGNAAVAGSLGTSRGIEYAAFAARPRSSGPGPGPGPGPGARNAARIGSPTMSTDSLTVRVTCTGPVGSSCTGSAILTVRETLVAGRVKAVSAKAKPRRRRARSKTVTIGKATFRIAAGKSTRVTVSLNSAGKALHKKFAKLPATLTIRVSGTTKKSHVRFPRPPPKKKPAKKK